MLLDPSLGAEVEVDIDTVLGAEVEADALAMRDLGVIERFKDGARASPPELTLLMACAANPLLAPPLEDIYCLLVSTKRNMLA